MLLKTPALRSYIDQVSAEEADPLLASQVNSVLVSPVERDASFLFKLGMVLLWMAALALPFILLVLFNDYIRENYEWYLKLLSNQ